MTFLKKFLRAQAGLAAIEFALILPVMVIMFFGVVEISNYIIAARRVSSAASTAADLVAQDTTVTDAEMLQIRQAITTVLAPMDAADMQLAITSVVADANNIKRVAWSDGVNRTGRAVNSIVSSSDFPADLTGAFQGAIMTEVTFGYEPVLAFFMPPLNISDRFYLRPRRSLTVQRTN